LNFINLHEKQKKLRRRREPFSTESSLLARKVITKGTSTKKTNNNDVNNNNINSIYLPEYNALTRFALKQHQQQPGRKPLEHPDP